MLHTACGGGGDEEAAHQTNDENGGKFTQANDTKKLCKQNVQSSWW